MVNSINPSKAKRQLELINEIVSNDIYNLGEQFFDKIVEKLNEALSADYTFVGELNESLKSVRTISLVNKEGHLPNFEYDLLDTPCENVMGQSACSYKSGITELFPKDQLLIDMGIEAYVGVPLFDSKKNPSGILVCLFENELTDVYAIESTLMIFASKASAELEHMKLHSILEAQNNELEQRVKDRTNELNSKKEALEATNSKLQNTLKELQLAQDKLLHSEKMASLGILTAGISHEINNPLQYLVGVHYGLTNYFEAHGSKDKNTTSLLLDSADTAIQRISTIVKGLNQFSRNNESLTEKCNIHEVLDSCLSFLHAQYKFKIDIVKSYEADPAVVMGNVGKLHQVFTNILSNAIDAIEEKGQILLNTSIHEKTLLIEIIDNGVGISEDNLAKLTDPFFTTKSPGKGTGLGLSISYAILQEHNAEITFESKIKEGTKVSVKFQLK